MRTLPFAVALLMTVAALQPADVQGAETLPAFRPPAVPLVACDPYFSVWSCADHLADDATRHWTGKKQTLTSLIRIDGKTYRLMGDEPKEAQPLTQVGLQVWPTRTIYDFQGAWVQVTLTFTTPDLPDDLDVLARPLTYLTWDVRSVDGRDHAVSLYFSDGADLAVNEPSQRVVWSREDQGGLTVLRIGSEEQPVLQKKGDDLRIDWGHVYAAAPKDQAHAANAGAPPAPRRSSGRESCRPTSRPRPAPAAATTCPSRRSSSSWATWARPRRLAICCWPTTTSIPSSISATSCVPTGAQRGDGRRPAPPGGKGLQGPAKPL